MNFKRYIPITKVDDDERMVYGFASTPDLDSDGEIITVEAIEKALPAYLQFPTLREMHQPKVAGTVKNTDIRPKEGLYIGAKVVDDNAWKFIKEDVYKGFSIGGNVIRKTGNTINELELIEISLVDVPANKSAKIEVWKKDKLNKNSETVWMLSNLMIQVKDMMMYCEYMGKDTKKLGKILEMIKSMISSEAMEPDEAQKMVLNSLNSFKFEDKSISELLRKVVITVVNDKIKKSDDPQADSTVVDDTVAKETEDTKEEVSSDTADTVEETGDKSDESVEDSDEDSVDETDEEESDEKEASAKTVLQKMEEARSTLKTEDKQKSVINKSMNAIADTVLELTKTVKSMREDIANLKKNPAMAKSKSAFVYKSDADLPNAEKKVSSETAKLEARLVELNDLMTKLGPNEFAKQGFSAEAGMIYSKLSKVK